MEKYSTEYASLKVNISRRKAALFVFEQNEAITFTK